MDNDHLVSRGGTEDLCSASIALVTITSAIVVARLCTRVLVLSSAGVDDILILIALVRNLLLCISTTSTPMFISFHAILTRLCGDS